MGRAKEQIMKKVSIIIIALIALTSCEKQLDITPSGLAGTWWFVPVYEVEKTDIAQLHWNKDGDLFIWLTGSDEYERPGYCRIDGDGNKYWQEIVNGLPVEELVTFRIIKHTGIELHIIHKGQEVELITL